MKLAAIRAILRPWFLFRALPHAKRADAIKARISVAKKKHKAWKPMLGQLQDARNRQLAAEIGKTWPR